MKMLLNGTWGCKRFWYQGPPGFRGLYFYRSLRYPTCRPTLRVFRFHGEGVMFGTLRHHFYWRWRYSRERLGCTGTGER